jgi:tetratricopeptide (TPR) repeat protein
VDEALVARIVAEELERRMTAGAREPEESAAPGRAAAAPAPEGVGHGEGGGEDVAVPPERSIEELVQSLKGRKFGRDDTNRLFSWLTLRKDRIKDVIAAIQKEIAADPANAELQVALATAYVADLTNNTMPGPQQGLVWGKAVQAYDEAIKLEPEHWTARFGKAFGTSMAPEFLGMRPEAIRQFEELLDIQKRKAPEPHFADTYFRLGTLYKDAGNVEKARELWTEGLRLFPDNEELKATIEASTKR